MNQNILYEDEDIMVIYKPAGIATQTARYNQSDMVSELKNYLARRKGNTVTKEPYLGIVHRLDQPVEGILVFAKTKRAAASLSEQVQDNRMKKYYFALVNGVPVMQEGELKHYLYKDGKAGCAIISEVQEKGAKPARLSYRLIKQIGEVSLLEVLLHTGRYHQIRAQLSYMGWPLVGDYKYGNRAAGQNVSGRNKDLALCAYRLCLIHPISGEKLDYSIVPKNLSFSPFLPDKSDKIHS